MKKTAKFLAIIMSLVMLTSIVGCGKKNQINYEDDMSKHVTLTFWTPIQSWAKGGIDTLADSDVYKEIEKKFSISFSLCSKSTFYTIISILIYKKNLFWYCNYRLFNV